ncbi:MAG TPA: helix-turn-helix domain-containing protein [Candidatus Aminicenantes bacterium]|nr:helix-turn-helix domain-containing protein [Candidatus Aminicenantes bacterium]
MTASPRRKSPETPFGIRLRAARKMAGMSMEDLAARLGGRVTKQSISKYETGRMMPSQEVLESLVEALKAATWGASPLRLEDAVMEKELPFDAFDSSGHGSGSPPKALRRRGLVSLPKEAEAGALPEPAAPGDLRPRPGSRASAGIETPRFCIVTPPRVEPCFSLSARRTRGLAAWRADAAVNEIRFRAGEKLSAKTEAALKYRIAGHLERYLELESVLGASVAFENPVAGAPVRTRAEVEAAAGEVRRRWELGAGPVVNLLGLLEDRGIKVCEARGIEGFEGLSGRYGPSPFVAVNAERPADRVRFTAAHELGHLLCGFDGAESPESECHAFGAALLLPRAALERTFTPAGRKVTLGDLAEIKQTYGVSLQAIMYRARALELVGDRQLRSFRETIRARGWAVEEPVAYRGLERATRFGRLLHYAVAAGIMDVARAAEAAGVPAEELEKEIGEIF